jgi:hypothetical protein
MGIDRLKRRKLVPNLFLLEFTLLLYVALTRARDFLLVSGVNPASEFLDDL